MRLELMTYALQKRRRDCVSVMTDEAYGDGISLVAPQVAILTDDDRCVEVMIPHDLSELIQNWPMLDTAMRSALLSVVRANALTTQQ
jgi:hypothetical protein